MVCVTTLFSVFQLWFWFGFFLIASKWSFIFTVRKYFLEISIWFCLSIYSLQCIGNHYIEKEEENLPVSKQLRVFVILRS